MNILLQECRMNRKSLIFWLLGIFFLTFAGITKYSGFSGEEGQEAIVKIMDQFPNILLAVLGISEVDFTNLPGFYAVIHFYILLCGSIYSIQLGTSCVTREYQDKTYEFLFSKPRGKGYILFMKSLGSMFFIFLFCLFYLLISILAVLTLEGKVSILPLIFLSSGTLFLVSVYFFAFSSILAAFAKSYQKASVYGSLLFLGSFIMNVVFRTLENPGIMKYISPFNFFEGYELLEEKIQVGVVIFILIGIVCFLFLSIKRFQKADSY